MRTRRHVSWMAPFLMAALLIVALLMMLPGAAAAKGPVTRYEGVVTGPPDYLDLSGLMTETLSGGRELWTGMRTFEMQYITDEPKLNGFFTTTLNAIVYPGGYWDTWGSLGKWTVTDCPGGSWRGDWHGTLTPNGYSTVIGEYYGVGDLAGLRNHKVYQSRGIWDAETGYWVDHVSGFISGEQESPCG